MTSETVLSQINSNALCMIAVSSFILFIDRHIAANDETTEWCRWLTESQSITIGHCLRYESNNKQ